MHVLQHHIHIVEFVLLHGRCYDEQSLFRQIDVIFASFIRSPENVNDIRAIMGETGKRVKILSKIETHDGCRRSASLI